MLAIEPISEQVADYYRALWTHKFMGAPALRNLALFLDGYLFAVLGYDPTYVSGGGRFGSGSSLLQIQYAMTIPSKRWRLNRLLGRLALSRQTLVKALNHLELYRCDTLLTVQLSPYPESKAHRGIMRLTKRKKDPVHGYRLIYQAPVSDLSWSEVLKAWWQDEIRWRHLADGKTPVD